MNHNNQSTHSIVVGYLAWILGFLGAHRFYYGKQLSGMIYFFTFGLLFIGWIIDFFLIPTMNREMEGRFHSGVLDYNVTWILFAFLGLFGIHRMYMGKWLTGLLYLLTCGFFLVGWLYDLWTLNEQISLANTEHNR
ncbi:MAG: TM2 domain-containing protein [Pseudomonadota bacterium]